MKYAASTLAYYFIVYAAAMAFFVAHSNFVHRRTLLCSPSLSCFSISAFAFVCEITTMYTYI